VTLALQSLFGFFALHALAWLLSERRGAIAWRPVVAGMVLTAALAVVFLKVPLFSEVFLWLNRAVGALDRATQAGTSFVFGYLGGAPLPYEEKPQVSSFILAFRALPLVLVISALSALFYYWRILPWIVRGFSWLLVRTMRVGGAVGLSAAANVFVGMVEAPLVVRPYIAAMSRSELFVTMTCGMATIAGTVMVLYATFLAKAVPDALAHILIASIIATPAAIAVALLMVPPDPGETAGGTDAMLVASDATGSMDAITRGTMDGVQLLINTPRSRSCPTSPGPRLRCSGCSGS
jgi:CNT family concentrative nucleoside transporter